MSQTEDRIKGSSDSVPYGEDDDSYSCGKYMYNDPTDPHGKRTMRPDETMRQYIDGDSAASRASQDYEEKKTLPEFLHGTVLSASFYRNLAEDYILPKTHKGEKEEYDYCMVLPANEDGTGTSLLTSYVYTSPRWEASWIPSHAVHSLASLTYPTCYTYIHSFI